MHCPDDLKYTKEHEWVRYDGKIATIGITEHAAEQLGDVVFVELPEEGESVNKGDTLGVVESVKAVSDIYSPIAGEVVEVNSALKNSPEQIGSDAYGDGWFVKLEVTNPDELDELMSAAAYNKFLAQESA